MPWDISNYQKNSALAILHNTTSVADAIPLLTCLLEFIVVVTSQRSNCDGARSTVIRRTRSMRNGVAAQRAGVDW